jgi:indole-3-glycerol phosphate synthase
MSGVIDGPAAPDAGRFNPEGALEPILREKLEEVAATMLLPDARDDGPLTMRLRYMAPETNYAFSDAIRASSKNGRLGVVADVKRVALDAKGMPLQLRPAGLDLSLDAKQLLSAGADALMVPCDTRRYGTSLADLELLAQLLREPAGGLADEPRIVNGGPVVAKDFVVHPIQIAQMVEAGASCVLLICGLVGPELELLLNTCTIMGCEALVEVHNTDEVLFAIECGATAILVNRRSRVTRALDMSRAVQMGALIPGHILSLAAGGYGTGASGQPINSREIEAVQEAGYDGIIVGRALRSPGAPASSSERAKAVIAEIKRHELAQQAAGWGA